MSVRHDVAPVGAVVMPFFSENLPPPILVVGADVEIRVRPSLGRFRTEVQRLIFPAA